MIEEITVDELDALLTEGSGALELVDVREPVELCQAHVPGARLVPLGTIHTALG